MGEMSDVSGRRRAAVVLGVVASLAACRTVTVTRYSVGGNTGLESVAAERALAGQLATRSERLVPASLDQPLKPRRIVVPAGHTDTGADANVEVAFTIAAGGDVKDVKIVKSAGWMLDDRVTFAVRQWTFEPITRGGAPTELRMVVPWTFGTVDAR